MSNEEALNHGKRKSKRDDIEKRRYRVYKQGGKFRIKQSRTQP